MAVLRVSWSCRGRRWGSKLAGLQLATSSVAGLASSRNHSCVHQASIVGEPAAEAQSALWYRFGDHERPDGNIAVQLDTKPRYSHPRPVPYALKGAHWEGVELAGSGRSCGEGYPQWLGCSYCEFTLVTDHQPLTTILGPKTGVPPLATAWLQWWGLLLLAHHYKIELKPTATHSNADGPGCQDCHLKKHPKWGTPLSQKLSTSGR